MSAADYGGVLAELQLTPRVVDLVARMNALAAG